MQRGKRQKLKESDITMELLQETSFNNGRDCSTLRRYIFTTFY